MRVYRCNLPQSDLTGPCNHNPSFERVARRPPEEPWPPERQQSDHTLCHRSGVATIISGMPSKPRPEDLFIEAFLSAYEDSSWADADKDWVDRRVDGGVEMLAKRKSDGKTLAIEHTLIQPFVGDIDDFKFFERAFLKIEDDSSLIVPGRWIQVFVPIHTLDAFPKAAARAVVVEAVHEWIRANRARVRDGSINMRAKWLGWRISRSR